VDPRAVEKQTAQLNEFVSVKRGYGMAFGKAGNDDSDLYGGGRRGANEQGYAQFFYLQCHFFSAHLMN
jgi:hypothetical protein